MTLMLHAGGEIVEYDALRAQQTPEPTATHVPIPHHRLVDIVRHMLTFYGHQVEEEQHALTKDGARYFGLLSLKSTYGDYSDTVILRNSHDKKFPIGIGFGSRVFICDNLAFIADHVVRRKHTVKAKHELPALISELVEPLANERERQYYKLLAYRHTAISDQLAHHAIMRMFKEQVINVTAIPSVLEQWEKPTYDWGEKRVWRLFNATTFALNGKVAEQPTITATLHRICDEVVEMA